MDVRLLACESLGVRSLATAVSTARHRYLIDPGVSIPPRRSSLPPHPIELAASYLARERIVAEAAAADTIILTHYHHDHFTPFAFREHEWSDTERARALYRGKRLLAKSAAHHLNRNQRLRAGTLAAFQFEAEEADDHDFGELVMSAPVPHGEPETNRGCVVMALFREGGDTFAFASDVQLLNDRAIEILTAWQPSVCIVSGPPLYLDVITPAMREAAAGRARALTAAVKTLVIDHHLTRTLDYGAWLAPIAAEAAGRGNRVVTGAEFAGRAPLLLEARRKELFRSWPVRRSYLPDLARNDPATREWIIGIARQLAEAGNLADIPREAVL
jgi:uncharacterized protein